MTGRRILLTAAIVGFLFGLHGATMAAEETSAPPPVRETISAGAGYEGLAIDGNERRFYQYVTPPSGMYLPELVWQRLDVGRGPSFELTARDLAAPDPSAMLWVDWAGFNLDAQFRRSRFFLDYADDTPASRRRDYSLELERNAGPDRFSTYSLSAQQVSVEGVASGRPVNWDRQFDSAAMGLRAGSFWLGLNYSRDDYNNAIAGRTEALTGPTHSYGISLSSRPADRTQISAQATWHTTDLDAYAADLRSSDAALTVVHPVRDDLTLTGQLRYFDIDETVIRNAYAQRQTTASLQGEYQPWPNTTFTAGWENALTDYVDGLQANTVGVESNAVRVGVRSRIGQNLKLTGRYSRFETGNRPLYYHVDQSLGASLIYSTRTRIEFGATFTPAGPWGLTGQWQRNIWDNDAQDISNYLETAMLTGWWQAAEGKLALTASLMHQAYDLPLRDITTLAGYDSDVDSAVLTATYALSQTQSAYATYARALSDGATSNEYWRLLLGYSQQTSSRDRLLVELTTGEFVDDYAADLGVGADLCRFEWRHEL